MNNLTKLEHKAMFALAIPMILSNITIPLLGLVDTAVIGHLPHAYYLGATAVGSMVISFATWLCGFLRMSTSGLVAQAYGAKDSGLNVSILLNGLAVAFVIALLLLAFQTPLITAGLALSGGSAEVMQYALQYCEIRVWGYPASLANIVLLGWLLGNHKAKLVMWLLIAINATNIILDVLFVVGFNWEVAGVAWATLLSEYIGLFLGIYLVFNNLSEKQKHSLQLSALKTTMRLVSWKQYVQINRDILIRTICLQITFAFITFQGARMGDTVVAANAILMNFLLLISFGLDGIANAAEVRVGNAYGQKKRTNIMLSCKVATLWTTIFAAVYSLVFFFGGSNIIHIISNIDSVTTFAEQFIWWIAILPLLSCWCYLLDGIYIGLTQAKAMRNGMVISTFFIFFPCWFILQSFENHGLWAAFSLFMLARGITLYWHFKQKVMKGQISQWAT